MTDWLDDIDAQMDSTVPYYVPRLVAEVRSLRRQLTEAQQQVGVYQRSIVMLSKEIARPRETP
jgi:capsule polysaccharide export protein KpsE/RkpR